MLGVVVEEAERTARRSGDWVQALIETRKREATVIGSQVGSWLKILVAVGWQGEDVTRGGRSVGLRLEMAAGRCRRRGDEEGARGND